MPVESRKRDGCPGWNESVAGRGSRVTKRADRWRQEYESSVTVLPLRAKIVFRPRPAKVAGFSGVSGDDASRRT
jgi:hypothetical protein